MSLTPSCSTELLEKTQIVLEEEPKVVHLVTEHRQAFQAHTERVARIALGIDADVAEDLRMHDTGSCHLEPSRSSAHATLAPAAAAHHALHVHFRRGLGERKVRCAEAQAELTL